MQQRRLQVRCRKVLKMHGVKHTFIKAGSVYTGCFERESHCSVIEVKTNRGVTCINSLQRIMEAVLPGLVAE